jgi:hypothetical protein
MSEEAVVEVATSAPVLLNLDAPRVITLKTKSGEFTYTTRRVTLKDWEQYFQGVVDQTMRVDGEFQKVYDADSAAVELADRVLLNVEPVKLPFSHRLAIGAVLRTATTLDHFDAEIADRTVVKLGAIWPTDGASHAYEGLVHRFRHPSIENLKRYKFETSRVRVRGEGKDSVSMYPSRMAIAMKLYDELIDSVDGYAVNGVALEGKENIVREMDGGHKAVAALHLFTRDLEVDVK